MWFGEKTHLKLVLPIENIFVKMHPVEKRTMPELIYFILCIIPGFHWSLWITLLIQNANIARGKVTLLCIELTS